MESGSILVNVSFYDDDHDDLMMAIILTILITTIMIIGGKWLNSGQCVISATSLHDHRSQPRGGAQAADKVTDDDVVVVDVQAADKVADADVLDNGPLDDGDEY